MGLVYVGVRVEVGYGPKLVGIGGEVWSWFQMLWVGLKWESLLKSGLFCTVSFC